MLVAQHALERRLNTIAFEEEVLYPALERVKDGTLVVSFSKDEGVQQRALESGE